MKYFDELKKSMNFLAKKNKTIFIGQAVKYPGTAMYNTLKEIKKEKKVELPVSEELQMGFTIGLMLEGFTPISIFPRYNFLLLAINQLVNHLDKLPNMTGKKFSNAIIRTSIGSIKPLNPQCQHVGDFTNSIKQMTKNINIIKLNKPDQIFPAYKKALSKRNKKPSLIIEHGDYYNLK